ncbi:MAG TPA: TIGR02281 family clan AA aspartic protease [Burkholderiales bacterium]|nr:TIGR02281 family clan AA aspartic protease [Burkholderiales bacterium]
MATGFMRVNSILLSLLLACAGAAAHAGNVSLIGVIGERAAVLSLDGGEPKTVKVGQKWNGITVRAVGKTRATVEIDGATQVLQLGQHYRGAASASGGRESVALVAGPSGHFLADGAVNGVQVQFVVDTGATLIALPGAQAARLGIDYRKGARGMTQTANGPVEVFRVRLDSVRVGAIELNGLEGIVIEKGLPVALLGMSFLSRVDMRQEGDRMTLTRRF